MTSIRRNVLVRAHAHDVWDAVSDVAAPHVRLVPGLVTETTMVPGGRLLHLPRAGLLVREWIIDVDENRRRLVHSLYAGWCCQYVSTMQVLPSAGGSTRLSWVTDFCNEPAGGLVQRAVDEAVVVMGRTLEDGGLQRPGSDNVSALSVMNSKADRNARRLA